MGRPRAVTEIQAAMVFVHRITGLPIPRNPPPVLSIPIDRLAALAGIKVPRAAVGFTDSTAVRLLDVWPAVSLADQAALVHEIAHWMAIEAGTVGCYADFERQAYAVQHAWLQAATRST